MAQKTFLDPKQQLFLKYYTDPKSETWSNALQSGLKAGYSQNYSETITCTMPDWLLESVGDMKMLRKAERNLQEVQDLSIEDDEGNIREPVLRERNKVDFFIAERLGKKKYSTRQELTGENGEALQIQVSEVIAKKNQLE